MEHRYEPKQSNRFVVNIYNEHPNKTVIVSWAVVNCSSIIGTMENGKCKWNNITITFKDYIAISVSKGLWEILVSEKPILIEIQNLDPTGVVIDKWIIESSEFQVNFGIYDYSNSSQIQPTMTLKPDFITYSN